MTVILRSQVLVCLSLVAMSCLADERPNIVLIVADDVGYSDIGAYSGAIRTPNTAVIKAHPQRANQCFVYCS